MVTKYQPLVDHVVAQTEGAVTLSFTEIEAILGWPLPQTMQVDTWVWKSGGHALQWRLDALGWNARLDWLSRCVIFTRDAGGCERDEQ